MRILICGGRSDDTGGVQNRQQYLDFFRRAAPDAEVSYCPMDELVFLIGEQLEVLDGHNGFGLVSAYDLVVFRGKLRESADEAAALSEYLRRNDMAYYNDYRKHRTSSKLNQAVEIRRLGLPHPPSIVAGSHLLVRAVERSGFAYPLIVKDVYGSHGDKNFLVRDDNELAAVLGANPQTAFIVQEYIDNDGDYRVLIVGGRHMVIHRRAVGGSHLNNTSKGGEGSLLDDEVLPAGALQDAHTLAREMGMTVAGVDILVGRDGSYALLEVNSQPQYATGSFLEEKADLFAAFLKGFQDPDGTAGTRG